MWTILGLYSIRRHDYIEAFRSQLQKELGLSIGPKDPLLEAARMNVAAVRKAFKEGVARMEQALGACSGIAWLSLAASRYSISGLVC
jgi:hypothetical protein